MCVVVLEVGARALGQYGSVLGMGAYCLWQRLAVSNHADHQLCR